MRFVKMLAACMLALCALWTAGPALADYSVVVDDSDLSLAQALPKSVQTVALFLTDCESSSDVQTVLLASIDRESGRACMTDLRTDLMAEIPQVGSIPLAKIYVLGGPNLMMKSINELLEMNVSSYVTLDVSSFVQIAESVGGMQMTLSAEEAAALGCAEGLQTLDGAQTMAYMRLPDEADAARSHQYKAVMQLLYQGTRDKNPFALMGLARKLMSTMTTNMGLMDMISLATTVMGGSEREEYMLPSTTPLRATEYEGMTAYTGDWTAIRQELHAFLFP